MMDGDAHPESGRSPFTRLLMTEAIPISDMDFILKHTCTVTASRVFDRAPGGTQVYNNFPFTFSISSPL